MEVIRVSSKQMPPTYVNEVKQRLRTNKTVELHALEGGITVAIKAADSLIHFGYAKIAKFETSLLEDEGQNGKFKGSTKVMIRLDKSPDFDKASQEFEKNKAFRSS